ncbi:MAG: hypothetical protein ACLQLG_16060 [Thermoguttaceae bacterium]
MCRNFATPPARSLGDKPRFANDLRAVDCMAARYVLLTAIEMRTLH